MATKQLSQFDPGEVLKSAHDDKGRFLRVDLANRKVPSRYTRVELTYNGYKSVTNAKFYWDQCPEITLIETLSDVSSSLNNKYFLINSTLNSNKYYVWFDVGGAGVDPLLPTLTGLKVSILPNDDATIIAMAVAGILNLTGDFTATRRINKLTITNKQLGESDDSGDVNTGFSVSTKQDGITELEADIDIPYENDVRYIWNDVEGRFELSIAQEITGGLYTKGLSREGKVTEVTLNSTTWTALPGVALFDRNAMSIQNYSGIEIKLNYNPIVSGYVGVIMKDSSERYYDIKDNIVIYAKSQSGNPVIVIEELS